MKYKRSCKYCSKTFETPTKFSKVCRSCKEKNHKKKVNNNIFNGNGHKY